jgi:dCMP deaminase
MASQSKLDEAYLDICKTWSKLSYAKRKKVGCIIVKDGAIISDGYNGTPKGFDNVCEIEYDGNLKTKDEVLHAESNAITKLAKSTQSSVGATMYITISPCLGCAKLIIQSGISRVVYKNFYRSDEGIQLLKQAKIKVEQYEYK